VSSGIELDDFGRRRRDLLAILGDNLNDHGLFVARLLVDAQLGIARRLLVAMFWLGFGLAHGGITSVKSKGSVERIFRCEPSSISTT
jgi:hypothetical protein